MSGSQSGDRDCEDDAQAREWADRTRKEAESGKLRDDADYLARKLADENGTGDRTGVRPLKLTMIELADTIVVRAAAVCTRTLVRLHVRLDVWRLRADPTTQQWIEGTRKAIANGTIAREIERQPTPQALAEELKRARREA